MGKRVQVLFAAFVGLLFAAVLPHPPPGPSASVTPVGAGETRRPRATTSSRIEFSGNRGYAAGKFGTLLRTEDARRNLDRAFHGHHAGPFRVVRLIDSDSLVIAGGCAVAPLGRRWPDLQPPALDGERPACAGDIASLHFPSSEVGYLLVQDGTVLRTADGGQTWTRKTAVPDTVAFRWALRTDGHFLHGPRHRRRNDSSSGASTALVDGGNSWTRRLHGPTTSVT